MATIRRRKKWEKNIYAHKYGTHNFDVAKQKLHEITIACRRWFGLPLKWQSIWLQALKFQLKLNEFVYEYEGWIDFISMQLPRNALSTDLIHWNDWLIVFMLKSNNIHSRQNHSGRGFHLLRVSTFHRLCHRHGYGHMLRSFVRAYGTAIISNDKHLWW